jgi:hypothetical protein
MTSRGRVGRDRLEGDYDVVRVLGDRYTESMGTDDSILRVVRD